MRIPVELPANWIFRLHESEGRRAWMAAVERFTVANALAPMYAVTFPIAVWSVGWGIALRMTALQVLASLGKRPAVRIFSAYIVALGILVPMVSVMIAAASRFIPLFVVYAGGFAGGWWKIRSMRRKGWGETALVYEDTSDAILDLGIADVSSRMPSSATT